MKDFNKFTLYYLNDEYDIEIKPAAIPLTLDYGLRL